MAATADQSGLAVLPRAGDGGRHGARSVSEGFSLAREVQGRVRVFDLAYGDRGEYVSLPASGRGTTSGEPRRGSRGDFRIGPVSRGARTAARGVGAPRCSGA